MHHPSHLAISHTNRNSFVETDDLDLVTDFLLDALFLINLGELVMLLADTDGFAEQESGRWCAVPNPLAGPARDERAEVS